MVLYVSLFILALAVSIDSFGVGITYGMRNITIPIRSIMIVALCSGGMILVAMGLGQGIIRMISPQLAEMIGAFILMGLGIWALYNIARSKNHQHPVQRQGEMAERPASKKVWTIEIKKLGIVIQVLRTPMAADMDRSGVISGGEAFILGVALSLDAFGAGIGASLFGYSPWTTALLIATMSSLFVYLGIKFGDFFSQARWMSSVSYLPGVILILFGVLKLL